ncbi:C40 family peptidase [Actinoalloteichus hymeniacidonis]|uniref:NlpC/P60 family protein n=1 Tax=Actinoalloteichus hymeniacidonis TaxID=340345 RepID=A0AAC9N0J0_9PSEU|nr:C40 family peptidase [Actinoalloteichus hymeniacidonis]AOS65132.1 NlpC/P60 family protein [Actinoalloteichus hymeniacidonis]MBB5906789.1 cell wall-associated NlpC family hydrolase [Actinoalloteichus hymeniacidonis]
MRGAMAATVVAMAVSLVPAQAIAQELPDNKTDAVAQLEELAHEAVVLTEEWHRANDDLEARQAELEEATTVFEQSRESAEQARGDEELFRGNVDELANASYQGARFNKLSALLVAEDPQAFLDQLSALDVLAAGNAESLDRLTAVVMQAEEAEESALEAEEAAAEAAAEAEELRTEIDERREEMDIRIAEVEEHIDALTAEEREQYESGPGGGGGGLDEGEYEVPPGTGTGSAAVQSALSRVGMPYVYGAQGPGTFDCSGLMLWAYNQVGVSLPRNSAAQASTGMAVSRSQLAPGDLIAYGNPSVHHIGMYVGNGNVVHAPTPGQNVKVVPIDNGSSSPIVAMRRVA